MKKLLFLFASVALITASSCNKCYNCNCPGAGSVGPYCQKNYTSSQLESLKVTCINGAVCTWDLDK